MKELTSNASILQHIYDAKNAHKEWVRKADRLVNGLNADKTFIPLDSSECAFGIWFNAHSVHLRKIKDIGNFIERIEYHHNQLHETYSKIYTIFFLVPENRSLMHKILTLNSKKVSKVERDKASIHLSYLKDSSRELLEVLKVLEEKVKYVDFVELNRLFTQS